MLNIFGALGAVSRLLPNYIQGQRQAVQDNWQDLNQYNQVQAGQLTNMFNERVMPWRINMFGDAANTSRWQSYIDAMTGMEKLMGFGGRAYNALASNVTDPQLRQQKVASFLNMMRQGFNPNSDLAGLQDSLLGMGVDGGFAGFGQQPLQQQPMPGTAAGTGAVRAGTQQATAAQDVPR